MVEQQLRRGPAAGTEPPPPPLAELLGRLSVGQLRKRALGLGIDEQVVDEAMDDAQPKPALQALLLAAAAEEAEQEREQQQQQQQQEQEQEEQEEQEQEVEESRFAGLTLGQLLARAESPEAGLIQQAVDFAMDAAQPKLALAALLAKQ